MTGRDHLYHQDARTLNTYVLPNESRRIGRKTAAPSSDSSESLCMAGGNDGYPEIGPNVAKGVQLGTGGGTSGPLRGYVTFLPPVVAPNDRTRSGSCVSCD